MTYEEWKLELIHRSVNETRVRGRVWKLDVINNVLAIDGDYTKDFKEGATPEDVWEGEIDAIGDSQ